jgi:diguanylate cyclase (GGDEF)-like protein
MAPPSIRYKSYDLGRQPLGTVVEVALSCINNVRLMDARNFELYRQSKPYKFFGGTMQKTPAKLSVPQAGHWHVVVDKDGFPFLANSNVRTIQPAQRKTATIVQVPIYRDEQQSASPANDETISGPLENASLEIEQIRMQLDEFRRMANTDALTLLNNRRSFDDKLAAVFKEPQARRDAFLVLADIDHFKTFNDTYGHTVGDMVLTTVATVMKCHVPSNVFVARTGGEEFALIVENETADGALAIANRVRCALEATPFTESLSGAALGTITISMGLCPAISALEPQDLYRKSDAALYASKKAGRNRCSIFDATMQEANAPKAPKATVHKDRTQAVG